MVRIREREFKSLSELDSAISDGHIDHNLIISIQKENNPNIVYSVKTGLYNTHIYRVFYKDIRL